MRANQLRLWFASMAYVLLSALRRIALGRKVSDEYTVPVCRLHHRELHRYGDEASWWAAISLDPIPIALSLWKRSGADRTQVLKAGFSQPTVAGHSEATQEERSEPRR